MTYIESGNLPITRSQPIGEILEAVHDSDRRNRGLILVFLAFFALANPGFSPGRAQESAPPAGQDQTADPLPAAIPSPTDNGQQPAPANGAELPTPEALQSQLTAVEAEPAADESFQTRLVAALRSSLEQLRTLAELRQREAAYRQAIETVVTRAEDARDKLAALQTQPGLPEDATNEFAPLSVEVIRQRRTVAEADFDAARSAQQALEATERERIGRATTLATQINEARTAIDEAVAIKIGESEGDPQGVLRAARENERRIAIATARQRLATLQAEQAMLEAETDLLPLQVEAARAATAHAGALLKLWNDLLSGRKRYRVETELAEYQNRLILNSVDTEGSLVLTLETRWLDLISENAALQRTTAARRARLDEQEQEWKQNEAEIKRDLESAEGLRPALGLKLLRARDRLESPAQLRGEIAELDEAIERTRQLQSEVYLTLEDIRDFKPGDRPRAGTARLPRVTQAETGLQAIDPEEISLLRRLLTDTESQIQDLIEFKSLLELNRRRIDGYRSLVDAHVVWIRDATTFRPSALPNAWRTLRRTLQPKAFADSLAALIHEAPRRPELLTLLAFFGGLPLLLRLRLQSRLRILNRLASLPTGHPLAATFAALAVSLIIVLPLPVVLEVAGVILIGIQDESGFSEALGEALQLVGALVLPLIWSARMLAPNGLAETHFDFQPERNRLARRAIFRAVWLGVPVIFLWNLTSHASSASRDGDAARLLFVVSMALLAAILARAFHPQRGIAAVQSATGRLSEAAKDATRPQWLGLLLPLLPLILAFLSLAGYTHAAILMADRLYWSLWLGLGLTLAYGLLKRWLAVRQVRRHALGSDAPQSATAQASPPFRSDVGSGVGSGVGTEITRENSPISQPDDRWQREELAGPTQRLLNASMWVAVLVGGSYLWAPVLPIIGFLDRVELWPSVGVDGTIVPITLANFVLAVPILFLAIVSARNVPGLVEITLLEKLPLDKPARYAITSLASYAILSVGIWLSFSILGLRWDSIQWLVAALGVGLGFGLQEIFANFVSGVILLFEQPIRVGDVVTIGDTTGTVTRIRIRSTIVRNWERQELIIPNKSLITDRIINWTLSDASNRLEIRVGVAYGSDTALACRLLSEICNQHEHVMIDPKPSVLFDGFGDSALNLVARCFVATLENRMSTLHELNTAIDQRFRQAGIEIAFPQQDIHIRTLPAGQSEPVIEPPTQGDVS